MFYVIFALLYEVSRAYFYWQYTAGGNSLPSFCTRAFKIFSSRAKQRDEKKKKKGKMLLFMSVAVWKISLQFHGEARRRKEQFISPSIAIRALAFGGAL